MNHRSLLWLISLSMIAASCSSRRAASEKSPVAIPHAGATQASPVAGSREPPKLRLGNAAAPTRYALELTLVPTEEIFSGQVDIDLQIREPRTVIWLNGSELEVTKTTLQLGAETFSGRPVPGGADFVGLAFDREIPVGSAKLRIEYQGKLSRRNSNGLFKQQDGDEWYVFTHFEPLDARRAFPCFDEPDFKVPWQITLHVPQRDVALSNTPIVSESNDPNGMKTVRFAETPPLPSYLIALAVGPFEVVDAGKTSMRASPVRIVTPKARASEARYAAASTPEIISALERYFGSPYPYQKLDSIAVPQIGGAMENPGLVTYTQLLLLMRPDEATTTQARRYASVCAHELAHQWFGDLVTMNWWNDTWLNEAFATWMADKLMDQLHPSWGTRLASVGFRSTIMGNDSLVSARRIRQPIESNNDISNAFDQITYNKGAAVLAMFESWIGPDKFQRGVQRYLEQHAWGNATADDFLAVLGEEAGRDVAAPFSTFLDQSGVPSVSVELQCAAGSPPHLALRQQRYLPLGSRGSPDRTWQIPICVRYGRGQQEGRQCTLLSQPAAEMTLDGKGCPDWVLGNDAAGGYYRVRYQGDLLQRLLRQSKRLTIAERLSVFGDVQALVHAGQMPASEALSILPKLVGEPERHLVASTAAFLGGEAASRGRLVSLASSVSDYLVPEHERPKLARFVEKLYGAKARALGWKRKPGESEDTLLLRPILVGLVASVARDKSLIAQAKGLAVRWIGDRKAIDPELADVVLRVAAENGDRTLYDRFYQGLSQERDRRERAHLFRAFSAFRDPELVSRSLQLVLADQFDPRESMAVISRAHVDPRTQSIVFEFIKNNFDALAQKLPRDAPSRLPVAAMGLCDESRRAEVESFFQGRSTRFTGGPRILDQALEQLTLCSAFRKAQQPSVVAFLQKY